MSATGRGRARNLHDYYATPAWATRLLAERLELWEYSIHDPCAGDGAILKACAFFQPTGTELQPVSAFTDPHPNVAYGVDGFAALKHLQADRTWVVTNPPYLQAQQWVDACLAACPRVAMLLRLNFLEGKKRKPWWDNMPPCDLYVLPNRPSFTSGGTDACAYAWFVWSPDATGRWEILPLKDDLWHHKLG